MIENFLDTGKYNKTTDSDLGNIGWMSRPSFVRSKACREIIRIYLLCLFLSIAFSNNLFAIPDTLLMNRYMEPYVGLKSTLLNDPLSSNLNYKGFAIGVGLSYNTLRTSHYKSLRFDYTDSKLTNEFNDRVIRGRSGSLSLEYLPLNIPFYSLNTHLYVGGYLKASMTVRESNNIQAEDSEVNEDFASIGPSFLIVRRAFENHFLMLTFSLPLYTYISDLESKIDGGTRSQWATNLMDYRAGFKYLIPSNEDLIITAQYTFEYYRSRRLLLTVRQSSHLFSLGFMIRIR